MPTEKLKREGTLGRVTVLVEERPKNRAAVRMHIRQTTADEVLETIGVARERLEQLLKDAAKVTAIRERVAKLVVSRGIYFEYFFREPTSDESMMQDAMTLVHDILEILEAP